MFHRKIEIENISDEGLFSEELTSEERKIFKAASRHIKELAHSENLALAASLALLLIAGQSMSKSKAIKTRNLFNDEFYKIIDPLEAQSPINMDGVVIN